VQEENGPILVTGVGLIRQHQLGKHILVSSDRNWILMFHNRAPVDIKGGDEDIFDMVLG
jgi:hypothetical protein